MNTWICIAWEDQVTERGTTLPCPITKEVSVPEAMSSYHVLTAFRRRFHRLRNHTVHLKSPDTEQVVQHQGPDHYPIALDQPLSPAKKAMREAHGTPPSRRRDGALQIEPPEQITLAGLATHRGEVTRHTPESGSNPRSPRESRATEPRPEPRRATNAPPSGKDCALTGADRSVAKAEPSLDCSVV